MITTDLTSHCCRQHRRVARWLLRRRLRRLRLDDAQQHKLNQLLASASSASRNRAQAEKDLREVIDDVIAGNTSDHEQAVARIRSAAECHVADTTAAITALGEFSRQLEPWQRQQLLKLSQQHWRCAPRWRH